MHYHSVIERYALPLLFFSFLVIAGVQIPAATTPVEATPHTTAERIIERYQEAKPVVQAMAQQTPQAQPKAFKRPSRKGYPIPDWVKQLDEDVDKALILAIVKKESRFDPDAGSYRGAQGLMQIMPETAQYVARQERSVYRLASRHGFDLTNPRVNLAIGMAYVRYLQSKPYIGTNKEYLLAAYNAGPAALLRWKKEHRLDRSRPFVETIDYSETRDYVRDVMAYYRTYRNLLKDSPYEMARTDGASGQT